MSIVSNHSTEESFLSIQFFACIPLSSFIWTSTSSINRKQDKELTYVQLNNETSCSVHLLQKHETWSENCQLAILNETIFHARTLKFAPSVAYQKIFLKHFINKVEACGGSCSEDAYTYYVNLLAENQQEFSFKSYYLSFTNNYVTLQESTNMLSGGTTGLVTWKGGLRLAEWCLSNQEKLIGKRVIELGCGAGLTGLVVSKLIQVTSYTFTDVHPNVLEQLNVNLRINDLHQVKHHVARLDWQDSVAEMKADVVLAADVVFDPSLLPDLAKTLRDLLCFNRGSVAYIASTVRNEDTYRLFTDLLDQIIGDYEEMNISGVRNMFVFNRDSDIRLIKLSSSR